MTAGRLVTTAAIGIAAAAVVTLFPVRSAQAGPGDEIRPFRVKVPEKDLVDLRHRLKALRWPERETVADQSQGVRLETMRALTRYWVTDYDWRRLEARLNALPQFITEIDGLDIHFIHVRSKHPGALPLIITHGWPGSIVELLEIIDPLIDPTAHGASAADAFHVVIPSLPGYGFSGTPTSPGWNIQRIARAWHALMKRLGYDRYVHQGGDVGAVVSEVLARQAPKGLLGVHLNLLQAFPPEIARAIAAGDPAPAGLSAKEKAAYEQRKSLALGYFIMHATRPQTIGYSLMDSPAGLAAWMIDHDRLSYELIARAFEGRPVGGLTRDAILDNITLYWLTGTGASSARLYWEAARAPSRGEVFVPAAFTVFPDEVYRAPRTWVERTYRNLIYFNEASKGGHFAAWEQPALFASEVRAAFRPLRQRQVRHLGHPRAR